MSSRRNFSSPLFGKLNVLIRKSIDCKRGVGGEFLQILYSLTEEPTSYKIKLCFWILIR